MLVNIHILRAACRIIFGSLVLVRSITAASSTSCNQIKFSRQFLVTCRGRPGDVTDSMVELIQQSILRAYNNVSACGVGNFRQITSVNITRNVVTSYGFSSDNGGATSLVNQSFTWAVQVQGVCRGCNAPTFQLFKSDPIAQSSSPITNIPSAPHRPAAPFSAAAPSLSNLPSITTFSPTLFPTATFSPAANLTASPPIRCNCPAPQNTTFLQALNSRYPLPTSIDKVLSTTLLFEETANCSSVVGRFEEYFAITYSGGRYSSAVNLTLQNQYLLELLLEAYNNLNVLNTNGVCDTQFRTYTDVQIVHTVPSSTNGGSRLLGIAPHPQRQLSDTAAPQQRRLAPTRRTPPPTHRPTRSPPPSSAVFKASGRCSGPCNNGRSTTPDSNTFVRPPRRSTRRALNMEHDQKKELDVEATSNPTRQVVPIETNHFVALPRIANTSKWEERIDLYHHRRLPVLNGRCYCQANTVARRVPFQSEYIQAINNRLLVVGPQGAGVITIASTVKAYVPKNVMNCTVRTKRLQTTVTVNIRTTRQMTEHDKTSLGRAFQTTYNALTRNYCDPLFRTVKAVRTTKEEEHHVHHRSLKGSNDAMYVYYFYFAVIGTCRNACSVKKSTFFDNKPSRKNIFDKPSPKHRTLQVGAAVVVVDEGEENEEDSFTSSSTDHVMTAPSEPPPPVLLKEITTTTTTATTMSQRMLQFPTAITQLCFCPAFPIASRAPTLAEFQVKLNRNVMKLDPSLFSVYGISERLLVDGFGRKKSKKGDRREKGRNEEGKKEKRER